MIMIIVIIMIMIAESIRPDEDDLIEYILHINQVMFENIAKIKTCLIQGSALINKCQYVCFISR